MLISSNITFFGFIFYYFSVIISALPCLFPFSFLFSSLLFAFLLLFVSPLWWLCIPSHAPCLLSRSADWNDGLI
ncbi:hypothetical protein BDV26DRAFT_264037, partial [Aspergillus bertholletiae]